MILKAAVRNSDNIVKTRLGSVWSKGVLLLQQQSSEFAERHTNYEMFLAQLREQPDYHLRLLRKYLLVTRILGCYVLDINHPCHPGAHLIRIPSHAAPFKTWPSFLVAIKFNKISSWLSYLEAEMDSLGIRG